MTPRDLDNPRQTPASSPDCSEGESNLSPRRRDWNERLGARTREAIARDAAAFVHQSVSSPCMSAISKAKGIWIEDMDGRRYMDFHGNNVHHIGYGHPKLKAAIAKQMELVEGEFIAVAGGKKGIDTAMVIDTARTVAELVSDTVKQLTA